MTAVTGAEKVREIRLRRAATRQNLMLVKSRRRDPNAIGYGLYVFVDDSEENRVGQYGGQAAVSAFRNGAGMTLDEAEEALSTPPGKDVRRV